MIGRLKGVILEKNAPDMLLDVRDVAYELQAPMTTFYHLGELGEQAILFTHLSVSENSQQLFGFANRKDRELFRLLIKVSGIGPKLAVSILSMEVDDFVRCVLDENVSALVKLPGVGKKTAERLVVEMKDKLKAWAGAYSSELPSTINVPLDDSPAQILEEATSALVALGYRPADAKKVVSSVAKQRENISSEDLIRAALKSMIPA